MNLRELPKLRHVHTYSSVKPVHDEDKVEYNAWGAPVSYAIVRYERKCKECGARSFSYSLGSEASLPAEFHPYASVEWYPIP